MTYVEFPFDQIIDLHVKKKDEPPPDGLPPGVDPEACGMSDTGYAVDPFFGYAIDGCFTLDGLNLWGWGADQTPGHDDDKPFSYFMEFQSLLSAQAGRDAMCPENSWNPTA